MTDEDKSLFTEEQMSSNPAVDPKLVAEAMQLRREMERLGVWEEIGPVSSSFRPRPYRTRLIKRPLVERVR